MEQQSPSRGTLLLLAATLASLLVTLGMGYETRLSLIDANASVVHTHEVQLATGDARLALARGDAPSSGD